jgi:2-polyprenyl-3-methyl-5-hydroxy-6-metoxy-1,4-benzoquinol methylase
VVNDAEARLYNHVNQLLAGHEKLLSDAQRNKLLYRALKEHVTSESSVLDIGSGSGIWAVAAATLGAKSVVAIEEDALLIGIIKTLAAENGVAHKVEVVQGDSRQVQLGKEFDIVISETIGHLVFDESIASIMIDARERFLKAGGILIPETVALVAAAAHLKTRHEKLPAGIPMTNDYFQSLALNIPVGVDNQSRLQIISSPQELIQADLGSITATPELDKLTARWELADTRQVNCFAVWAAATLVKGVSIKTSQTTSWLPIIYRIRPFKQEQGEIEFNLKLTSKSHYWTASLSHNQEHEAQSYSPAQAATEILALARTDINAFSHLKRMGQVEMPTNEH